MPINLQVKIKCQLTKCYWNIDDEKEAFDNNCACASILLTDRGCRQFIDRVEANTRLDKVFQRISINAKT